MSGLLNNIQPITVASTNSVSDAFEKQTDRLTQIQDNDTRRRNEEQDRKDRDMLQVFEYAGDGYVTEAKMIAQSKGLQVPEEVFKNGDLAKGLSLAGKIYGNNPEAAQKFTNGWMMNNGADFQTRLSMAQQAAGGATNPEDRQLSKQIAFEKWKMQNKAQNPGSFKDNYLVVDGVAYTQGQDGLVPATNKQAEESKMYDFVQKGLNSYVGSRMSATPPSQEEMLSVQNNLISQYRSLEQNMGQPSSGLVNTQSQPSSVPSVPQIPSQTPLIPVQQNQIPVGLPQGSVMIGTTNGYPVYQAPNGDRFIDDGNTQGR